MRAAGLAEAVKDFELAHVMEAVTNFCSGNVEGHNPSFPVYPAQLVIEMRRIRDKEISQNATRRAAIAQIEDRSKVFHEDPVDVRRAAVAAGLARLKALNPDPETPEQAAEREAATKAHLEKHDAFFMPNDSDDARRARLWNNK